jgi:hypothetical protein
MLRHRLPIAAYVTLGFTFALIGCPADDSPEPSGTPEDSALASEDTASEDTAEAEDTAQPVDTDEAVDTTQDVPEQPELPAPDTKPVEPDTGPPTTVSLVDMFAFQKTPPESDPWYADGAYAEEWRCEPRYTKAETTEHGDQYDIETSFCGYVTIGQPLAHAVPAGAEISIEVLHYAIKEGDDGQYLLAVGMGDPVDIVWSKTIGVPTEQALHQESWVASRDYEIGEPIYWHISNHGDNNWALIELVGTF